MSSTKTIIGLTGYYCSGKSSAEKILEKHHGFQVIDVDKTGHSALEEKKDELIKHFGKNIITNGKVNRKTLGSIVFKDRKSLSILNSIVHPVMVNDIKGIIKNSTSNKIVISAALLFQMKLDVLCSHIIFIRSTIFSIITRAFSRDRFDIFRIISIILNQKKTAFSKKKFLNADIYYISNDKNLDQLKNQMDLLLKRLNLYE